MAHRKEFFIRHTADLCEVYRLCGGVRLLVWFGAARWNFCVYCLTFLLVTSGKAPVTHLISSGSLPGF